MTDKKDNIPPLPDLFNRIPTFIWNDWIIYKGETQFSAVNIEKSEACNRPIIDICYCATKCLNNIVEKSVNYVPEKFKPHPTLSDTINRNN